jgi:hypothetical protein
MVENSNTVVDSNHPLVGTWIEEDNHFGVTTVVYTIGVGAGRFRGKWIE